MFAKRILILVPHPDDEVVACCAAIGRAKGPSVEIFALYLSHGCVAREVMWPWEQDEYDLAVNRRLTEAKTAAKLLGITPAGWSPRPARQLWKFLPRVQMEIEQAIAANKIEQLWVPAYEGGNADHDAVNAVASLFKSKLSVLEFAEYNFLDGQLLSQEFPSPNGSEQIIQLKISEQQRKQEALALYASEKRNLGYVGTERECYRPLADYDYTRPPHDGKLWYTRFQWVPIPHPGVDRTKPADVTKAITAFLSSTTTSPPAPARQ